ncbi:MAG: hypothetical protein ACE5HB_07640 [Terriglobia bacterium]
MRRLAAIALLLACSAAHAWAQAPAFRSEAHAGNSSGNSLTITKPAGVVQDDVLVAFIAWEDDMTPTPPTGWTLKGSVTESATFSGYFWWKRATASEPADYTFDKGGPARWRTGTIMAYSGAITSGDPVDVFSSNSETVADTTVECLSITTTVDDTAIVALGGNKNGAANWTPPTGMTERVDFSAPISTADVAQATAGVSGEKVFTAPSSSEDVSFLLALKPPAGAPPPRNRAVVISRLLP